LGRVILFAHIPITAVFFFLWRKLFFHFYQQTLPPNNLLIIGNSDLDDEIQQYLKKMPFKHYKVAHNIYNYKENPGKIVINNRGSGNGLSDLVKESKMQEVEVMRALQWLQNKGILKINTEVKEVVMLDSNGKDYSEKSLPETKSDLSF